MDKILIVDDNQDNIVALKLLLESLPENYKIIEAGSGKQALDIISRELPTVILLDIQMPEMDGFEVCARIKQNTELPYIPIIFLSAFRQDLASKIKGYGMGADEFITKPYEKEILFARLRSVIKIKYLYDQLFKERNSLENKVIERTSELTKALAKAQESDRLKTEFLSVLSHEIRTPLNAIIGFSDLMQKQNISKEQSEYLEIVKENGNMLLFIFNDLLELSMINAGQIKLIDEPFSMVKFFRNIVSDTQMQIQKNEKDIEVFEKISDDINNYIITDRIRLQQIMNNLVSNSIKFTEKGFIEIGVMKKSNDYLEFYVLDSGIGIKNEKREIIFEKFRQADMSQTRKYGGTGLGLAISKRLVQLLGGEIQVQSPPVANNPGMGNNQAKTLFKFTLPYKPFNDQNLLEKKPLVILAKRKFKQILVVEDDIDNRILIQKMLDILGYKSLTASNGLEALDVFKKNPAIDLILMDIQMPVLDGLEATKKIREIEQEQKNSKSVPIIALSASVKDEDRENCLANGLDDFLAKPINEASLIGKLNAIKY